MTKVDFARRLAIDPVFFVHAFFRLPNLRPRLAEREEHLIAIHPFDGALLFDSRLNLGWQCFDELFGRATFLEVQNRRKHLFQLERPALQAHALSNTSAMVVPPGAAVFCCELIGVVPVSHAHLDVLIPLALALRAAVDLEDDLVVVDIDLRDLNQIAGPRGRPELPADLLPLVLYRTRRCS